MVARPFEVKDAARCSEFAMSQFKRVLVSNRGEIAIRIAKAASTLGIETVGIYAPADALSLHTRMGVGGQGDLERRGRSGARLSGCRCDRANRPRNRLRLRPPGLRVSGGKRALRPRLCRRRPGLCRAAPGRAGVVRRQDPRAGPRRFARHPRRTGNAHRGGLSGRRAVAGGRPGLSGCAEGRAGRGRPGHAGRAVARAHGRGIRALPERGVRRLR